MKLFKKNNLLILLFLSLFGYSQEPFVFQVNISNGGEDFTIPINDNYTYDYTVDWGDGIIDSNLTSDATHSFANDTGSDTTYTIEISGTFPAINFSKYGPPNSWMVRTLVSWGDNEWQTFEGAFQWCSYMTLGANPGIPDLSNVTSFKEAFDQCSYLTSDGGWENWDVGTVTNMESAFNDCSNFNPDISGWDVSKVTSMSEMFSACRTFNQDISDWQVGNVTDMTGMFSSTRAFNQNISGWNMAKVENIEQMFFNTRAFNQNLGSWDIGSVTNMNFLFFESYAMSTENLDATLIGWATDNSGVAGDGIDDTPDNIDLGREIEPMYCSSLTAIIDLTDNHGWTINADISSDCTDLFSFEVRIPDGGADFTIPVNDNFTYNYSVSWGDATTTQETSSATHSYANDSGADMVYTISIEGEFPAINFTNSISDSTNDKMITQITNWGAIEWESFSQSFWGCSNLTISSDAGAPDLSNVPNLYRTFRGCSSLNSDGGWENWDTTTINNMVETFDGCLVFNGDVSGWDVSNVTNMVSLFLSCHEFNQDISGWQVDKVENMTYMFSNAYVFNQDISNWNTENVTTMYQMFNAAYQFDADISGWNTSKVTTMHNMFKNATSFNRNLGDWDVSLVTDMFDIFDGTSKLSATNFDNALIGWATDTSGSEGDGIDDTPNNIDLGVVTPNYCDSVDTVTDLRDNHNWTIDAGFSYGCGFTFEVTVPPGGLQFTIFVDNDNYTYDYKVDWGNGIPITSHSSNAGVFYPNNTSNDIIFTLNVLGTFPKIDFNKDDNQFNDGTSNNAITKITNWGDIVWESFENSFKDCPNLTIDPQAGTPILTNVTSFKNAFLGCTSLNSDGGWEDWDTSNITSMDSMFSGCTNFNGDISGWNTSKVTGMRQMLYNCSSFDQSLENWDITSLTNLSDIFNGVSTMSVNNYDATIIGWGTDSSGVENDGVDDIPELIALGTQTPKLCKAVNIAIKLENFNFWAIDSRNTSDDCNNDDTAFIFKIKVDSSNPTFTIPIPYLKYQYLFRYDMGDGTLLFDDKSVTHTYKNLTSTPTEFTIKIYGSFPAIDFSSSDSNDANDAMITEIVNWGTIEWEDFSGAFEGCENLTISTSAGTPNLTGVKDFSNAFNGCTSLNSDAGWENWNTENVTNMSGMFSGATSFNGDISSWNTSNVTDLSSMFSGASSFNTNISGWSTSKATNLNSLFKNATIFNYSLENWSIASVSDIEGMFENANAITTSNFDATISGWYSGGYQTGLNLGVVTPTYCITNDIVIDLRENQGWTMQANIASDCDGVFSFDIVVPDGGASFTLPVLPSTYSYDYFVSWGDGTFNNNVSNQLTHSFANTTGADVTYTISIEGTFPAIAFNSSSSNDTNDQMVTQINNWGKVQWQTLESAFRGCTNLTVSSDAGAPDLSNAVSLDFAFYGCASLGADDSWSNWDVSTITSMRETFFGCTNFNGDVTNWNVSKVSNMNSLFKNTNEFDRSLENWDISSAINMSNIFENANAYYFENFDNSLIAWAAASSIPNNIDLGVIAPEYCASADAITELTANYGWTINANYTERCNNFTIDGIDGLVFQQSSKDFSLDLSDDFTAYDLSIGQVDITMDYTHATGTYVVSGDVTTTFGGNEVETTMSLTVVNKVVTNFSFGLSGSFELYSLSFTPDNLTFQYDLTNKYFEMFGGATISITDSETMSITLGSDGDPGLKIDDGDLEYINATVSADFVVGGLTFTPTDLNFEYIENESLYRASGSASIAFDGNTIDLTLGGSDSSGIEVVNGGLTAIDATISGDFTINSMEFSSDGLEFVYNKDDVLYEFYGDAILKFEDNEVEIDLGSLTDSDDPGIELESGTLKKLDISVTADFSIASVTISPDALTFVYDKDNSYYAMYGTANLDIDGNTIILNLSDADDPGLIFEGKVVDQINASITADFSMKNIDFEIDDMGLIYEKDSDNGKYYGIHGTATASLDGESMSITLGSDDDPGFQYYDSVVQEIDISVTADFSMKSISIQPTDLTFIYSKADDYFEMYGDVKITAVGDTIEAILGDEDDPGMIFQDSKIQHVNFGVTTDFSIAGLSVDVTDVGIDWTSGGTFHLYGDAGISVAGESLDTDFGTFAEPGVVIENGVLQSFEVDVNGDLKLGNLEVVAKDLDIAYSDDVYELSGELSITEVFTLSVTLGTDDQPGVEIDLSGSEPRFKVEDLTIEIDNANLGAIDIKEIKLEFNTVGIKDAAVKVLFPEGWEVDAEMIFEDVNGKAELNEITIAYLADNLDTAIEIFEGVQLSYLAADVKNLDRPSELEVTGTIGTIYGGGFTLAGESATFVEMTDEVTISSKEFKISGDVNVGAYRTDPGTNNWNALLGSGSIDLDAYFGHYVKATVNAKYPGDPLIEADLTAYFDNTGHFDGLLDVKFYVPSWVPFVGGKELGSADGALRYKKGDLNNSFGAAWVKIWTFWKTYHTGAKYNFGTRKISSIGDGTIDWINDTINDDIDNGKTSNDGKTSKKENSSSNTNYAYSFIIEEPAPSSVFVNINWEQKVDSALVTVVGPEGNYELLRSIYNGEEPDADNNLYLDYEENMTIIANDSIASFFFASPAGMNSNEQIKTNLVDGRYQVVISYPNAETAIDTIQIKSLYQLPSSTVTTEQLDNNTFNVTANYWSALPSKTLISFYINDEESFDGSRLLQHVDATNYDEYGNGTETIEVIPKHFFDGTSDVYFYVVIDDSVNPPFSSELSNSFVHDPDVFGTITTTFTNDDVDNIGLRAYLDINDDGFFDAKSSGSLEPFAISNENGNFIMDNLDDGTYNLRIVLPEGYRIVGGVDNKTPYTFTFNGTALMPTIQIEQY